MLARVLLAIVLSLAHAGHAEAERGGAVQKNARAHFELGRRAYADGRYQEAIAHFSAGYDLAPRSEFLLNIGQAHRQLGDRTEALRFFQWYLVEAPPGTAEVPGARRVVTELEGELAREAERPARPPRTAEPDLRPVAQPVPVASPVVDPGPPVLPSPTAQDERARPARAFVRRHWWIFPASAVVLTAVGVGIYLGVKASHQLDCGAVNLGCVTGVR